MLFYNNNQKYYYRCLVYKPNPLILLLIVDLCFACGNVN